MRALASLGDGKHTTRDIHNTHTGRKMRYSQVSSNLWHANVDGLVTKEYFTDSHGRSAMYGMTAKGHELMRKKFLGDKPQNRHTFTPGQHTT